MKTITIELSRRGHACLWESGGAWGDTGEARLVTNCFGRPKRPIYIKDPNLAFKCGEHALLPLWIDDFVIDLKRVINDCSIEIHRVIRLNEKQAMADLTLEASFKNGLWVVTKNGGFDMKKFDYAIKCGVEKVYCHECRESHFIKGFASKPFSRPNIFI
jgi:hypothetical protein